VEKNAVFVRAKSRDIKRLIRDLFCTWKEVLLKYLKI